MEAIQKAEAETGERKGHYLNVTAPTADEMMKRAEYAKEIGAPIIMHDYLTGGWSPRTPSWLSGVRKTACCCTSTVQCTRFSTVTHTTVSTSAY